jgi:hypothetical protein
MFHRPFGTEEGPECGLSVLIVKSPQFERIVQAMAFVFDWPASCRASRHSPATQRRHRRGRRSHGVQRLFVMTCALDGEQTRESRGSAMAVAGDIGWTVSVCSIGHRRSVCLQASSPAHRAAHYVLSASRRAVCPAVWRRVFSWISRSHCSASCASRLVAFGATRAADKTKANKDSSVTAGLQGIVDDNEIRAAASEHAPDRGRQAKSASGRDEFLQRRPG